jgi:ArsR family metal-binding transcriptional regulator
MSNSTTNAAARVQERFDASCYYRWVEPNSDITICLKEEAIDRLQVEVLRGLDSSPPFGKEVGGILLGWTGWVENHIEIVVEDFEPVPPRGVQSRFYKLKGEDHVRIEAALGHSARMRSAVGYYRSHNRPGLYLSPDDLQLIGRHFPGEENVFLLIKTLPSRACTAGFFFRKDGSIVADYTDSEVPLIPASDPSPALERPAGVIAAPPVLPWQALLRRISNRRIAYGGLLVATAAAFIAVVQYRVTQYRASTHLSQNPRTVLQSELTPPQIAAPAPQTQPSATNPARTPAADQRRSQPAPRIRKELKLPVSELAAVRPDLPSPPELQTSTAIPSLGAVAQAAVPAPENPVTPPGTLPNSASRPRVLANPAAIPPSTIEAPVPANLTFTGSVKPPGNAVTPKGGVATVPTAPAYIGPRVIQKLAPAVPYEVRRLIVTDTQLDVEVTISAEGKVTAARVMSTKGAQPLLLTMETLKAARLYRFEPAQQNGRNVPSVMVLTFRFEVTALSNKAGNPASAPAELESGAGSVRVSANSAAIPPSTIEAPKPASPASAKPPADAATSKTADAAIVSTARPYIGPRVIQKAVPTVPYEVRQFVVIGTELDVEVTISAEGKVTAARVTSTKHAPPALLTLETLKAARLFRFEPAQENGRKVPSVMVLTFHF